MFQRLTAYLLCFVMFGMNVIPGSAFAAGHSSSSGFNEAELVKKYPNAKVIRVSSEEYESLEKKLRQQGYRQSQVMTLAQNDIQDDVVIRETQPGDPVVDRDCAEKEGEDAGDESIRVMLDFTDDMMNSSNGSGGDEAAVVFVLIGTVVVVVWALYVFKYLYDVSLGNATCGGWNEITVVKSAISSSNSQHARFDGVRYSTGFRDGSLDVGIGFELGKADILLSEVGVLELKGNYWMLGPILRWRLTPDANPNYFQMNFVAGTTEHDEIGMLARASLGLLFGIGDAMQLGLNWGVLNINLDEHQGVISERSQYHYHYGVNVGFKF